MVEHGAMTPSPHADTDFASAPPDAARASRIFADRRTQALLGVAALAVVALAVGVPVSMLLFFGLVLLCPLMMLGMHGMHGSQHGHAGGDTQSDRALYILRERYARGELSPEQYESMRRELG